MRRDNDDTESYDRIITVNNEKTIETTKKEYTKTY